MNYAQFTLTTVICFDHRIYGFDEPDGGIVTTVTNEACKVAVVQAAPVFMDLDATVDKGIGFIEEAAKQGARLIAFPECRVPGYPWWTLLNRSATPPVQLTDHTPNPVVEIPGDGVRLTEEE